MAKLHISGEEEEQLIEVVRKILNYLICLATNIKMQNRIIKIKKHYKDNIWLDIANTIGKSGM